MTTSKTPGEKLFEEYLGLYGYDFSHEPGKPGALKRPDYPISRNGTKILCEVKDFLPRRSGARVGSADPYKAIRRRIEEGRRKFKEFKEQTCCLVFFNQGDHLAPLETVHTMLGAMYGDAGYSIPMNLDKGEASGPAKQAFFGRGKMVRPDRTGPMNTTISALITLLMVRPNSKRLEKWLEGVDLSEPEVLPLTSEKVGFDINESHMGVIVWENALSAKAFPRDVFNGPYDIRWGVVEGGQAIVHKGEKLPDASS